MPKNAALIAANPPGTPGYVVSDEAGRNLSQYGQRSHMKNTYNFTKGGFASNVPAAAWIFSPAKPSHRFWNLELAQRLTQPPRVCLPSPAAWSILKAISW